MARKNRPDLTNISAERLQSAKQGIAERGPVAKFGKNDRKEGKVGAKPGQLKSVLKKEARNTNRRNARSLFKLNKKAGKEATLAGGAAR